MPTITILGAGLVGSAMIRDLAADNEFEVIAVDASSAALAQLPDSVTTRAADLSDPATVRALVSGSDLAICAVPGFMGFKTLQAIIEAGTDVIDISFFPEDAFELDDLARQHDVTAVVDCGVAPGLCNIIAGRLQAELGAIDSYSCYVGGLPKHPTPPWNYRSVFSPIDVIEEYTRPARLVENGKVVVKEALSEVETITLSTVGVLEAFNTDGLRSLISTIGAPNMLEKTFRYPGHADLMRILREGGFFSEEPIEVGGQMVRPLDVTSRLLFSQWKRPQGEPEFTVLRVEIVGGGTRYTFDLYDEYDSETDTSSMARTTGYTGTIVARMVLSGLYSEKGISPPEFVGRTAGCYDALMAGYRDRNISVTERTTAV